MRHDNPTLVEILNDAHGLGFLGDADTDRHIRHATEFGDAVETALGGSFPDSFVDLGSGGGLPGLVLALRWPSCAGTLVDAGERRVAHLKGALERLGLDGRCQVLGGRAEILGHQDDLRERFTLVVARAFASPAVTAECAAPFMMVGGLLVVSEPPGDQVLGRWPATGLSELGLEAAGLAGSAFHFVVHRKVRETDSKYARRVGLPAKRPLF